MNRLSSAAGMLAKVVSAGAVLLVSLVITRSLEKGDAGTIFFCIAITSIMAALARLGLENVVTRRVAGFASSNDWGSIARLYRRVVVLVVLVGSGLSLGCILAAPVLSSLVAGGPSFTTVFQLVSLLVVPAAVCWIQACFFQGLGRIVQFHVFQTLASNSLFLVSWGFLLSFFPGVVAAIFCAAVLVASNWIACLFALFSWRLLSRGRTCESGACEPFYDQAKALLGVMLVQQVMLWAPQIFLGFFADMSDSAVFNSALRTAGAVTILLAAFNSLVFPRFAALHTKSQFDELRSVACASTRVIALYCLPLLVIMFVKAGSILSLFGDGFDVGVPILRILVIGQLVNVVTGPVGGVLMMTGHERDVLRCTTFALIVLLSMLVGLVPYFGLYGAAIAQAASLVAYMLSMTMACIQRLGFAPAYGLRFHVMS